MAKKKDTVVVTLECTEAKAAGVPPSRYTTFKNKKKHPDKLEMKKYNKYMKKHTTHKEIK
ncbi:MAG: 50S ribosomal protein L33 [Candidatus Caenarcaniphilales bacterium]|jgi:large subunit ribosomal protein L33|nr:50S ribosomal protein L33 [Candidatus Caenarcaniphilales bacterium]